MKFEGVFTPIITPYDDKDSINFDAIEAIIEDLISSGVHGFIIAGTTGEYYAQDIDERLQLMKVCKDVINNRLPYIVGTGAIRTEDSVFYAEEAAKIGADGILVATPIH
jgi:4-hydroxy-tetrahydrodipicolinate synthase